MNGIGIICHNLSESLIFTVNKLKESPNNIIFIHLDKKIDISLISNVEGANVHLIKDRISVEWGGFSQCEATLKILEISLCYPINNISIISGDDVPLRSNNELGRTLNSGIEYVAYQNNRITPVNPDYRVHYKYPKIFFKRNKNVYHKAYCKLHELMMRMGFHKNKGIEKLPKLYKGTNWFSISRTAILYIFEYLNKNPNYISFFENSFCSDEVFFHTILKTGDFKFNDQATEIIPYKCLRYIDWTSGPDYPKKLNAVDLIYAKNSTNCLFARKVDPKYSKTDLIKLFLER
ncbi:beta-1,6-N-acetylglucosaminyltransferase [Vibrio breoganii]|uniref:beta-1,6-N-acetylglucosaminyltransferase n=1 Tax=Vibrio breoganii TaxID=553239 RepID=UPI00030BA612|nr:beta-1,6-N-acetylglucosaminyltransferase [Vibrio breoganii]OED96328.1 hypothetical protein A1QG_13585 [Vibrio breoganii ZF-29]